MSFDLQLTQGDINFGPDGNPIIIENKDKLKQDISKVLLTPLGSDPGDLNYGSKLNKVLGQPVEFGMLQNLIAKSVSESMNYLQSLQMVQGTKQTLTFPEVIGSIDGISVSSPSLSSIIVQIAITSVAGLRTIFAIDLGQ